MSNNQRTSLTDKVCIFDLDSTLIYSMENMSKYNKLKSNRNNKDLLDRLYDFDLVDVVTPHGTGRVTSMWGVRRPYVEDFLLFAAIYFKDVYVWSAGKYKYVRAIVDVLWENIEKKPKLIYCYDDCIFSSQGVTTKPLSKIIKDPMFGDIGLDKILIIDDLEETFSENVQNSIHIPVYKVSPDRRGVLKEDLALIQLQCWLSLRTTMQTEDVRTLDKSKIFKTSIYEYQDLLLREN